MNYALSSLFPLVNTSVAQDIINSYAREHNWHELDVRTGNLGYGWIHYAFIRLIRPKRVLCVGSRYGFIPILCAMACKDNGTGIVDFVDAGFDERDPKNPDHWGGVGTWREINPDRYFRKHSVHKHIVLHVQTTAQFNAAYPDRHWDYIYIDGDHSYKGSRFDFNTFWPRLNRGGMLSLHDIRVKRINKLVLGVHRLWNEIKRKHPHETLELPGAYGLGILTKPQRSSLLVDV